ncbi:MAG: UPF0182 family protein [Terriglobia bacterium]
MKQDRVQRYIVAGILLLLVVAPLLTDGVNLLVDWLWFGAQGYLVIYKNILFSQIGLSGLGGIGFIILVGANVFVARSVAERYGYRVFHGAIELPGLDRFAEAFRWVVWLGVLLVGYAVGQWSAFHWQDYLLAQHAVPMHQADPLFHIDLGFYLFHLNFYWFLYHLGLVIVIFCLISAAVVYLLEGGVWVTPKGPNVAPAVRTHLMVLGSLLFLLLAYRARLAMYSLLFSSRGIVYGAGYTDVHATLPVLKIMLALCVVMALALVFGAVRGQLRPAIYSLLALALVGIVGVNVYPGIVQHFVVTPNELDKERPFISNAIEFTRQAYALNRFQEHHFSAAMDLTPATIMQNEATMRNVRLWDHKPLLTTFGQLQEIRTYYDFVNVDNDRYQIGGVYRQVSLSPRELSTSSLPSRNWINEHLIYTHGYGLCMGPVNEYTSDGLPVFFIKDVPPVSSIPLTIKRPEIYYGEVSNDYCFVDTGQQEFDYPAGDHDVYSTYSGKGGIEVGNIWRRLLFMLKFGQKNILFSSDIKNNSRVMIYRQIIERAQRLTPFLQFDSDPYMVVAENGSLYWMLDGYTASDRYPYSDPTGQMGNYIRNSVKATINAYTGQVNYYIADPTDPLIQVYSNIFPGVFHPLSDMPSDLEAHIRYPEAFFSVQAAKYAVFHMTDPRVFFNKEDLWRVARSAARGQAAPMTPYYTIMKLPEVGKKEEFILMVPFTPARKNNMIAWMAARCDAPNYGKVTVFTFPKQKLVYGPQQVESRIDQDPTISQQLTLWGQVGSSVLRGTLLVVPIGNAVMYIEPLYLAAQSGGALPQLKRVIVAYSDQVVMSDTLDDALSQIFGTTISTQTAQALPTLKPKVPGAKLVTSVPGAPAAPQAPAPSELQQVRNLTRQANQQYERALQLLKQGDWAGYGSEIKKLGQTLNQLAAQQK